MLLAVLLVFQTIHFLPLLQLLVFLINFLLKKVLQLLNLLVFFVSFPPRLSGLIPGEIVSKKWN
jgi:hypothetical protein